MRTLDILIVDDEQIIRNGLQKAITSMDERFQVVGAMDDGETAIQFLETADILPDVIITDIYMKYIDGLELIEIVNERYPLIKCMILSGHEEFRLAQRAIDLQVVAYVTKPIDVVCLHQYLERMWDEKKISIGNDLVLSSTRIRQPSNIVEEIKAYMHENYADRSLTLKQLADLIPVHPNYLTKIFREQTGLSCMQYLAYVRMTEAKKLLKQTDLKVNEIADRVGYDNVLYFSSYFKKWVGLSPSEFKEEQNVL